MCKIISVFNKHEDFIELQYNSIKKHVSGDYEYIVFNNAIDDKQAQKNEQECKKLNIKCIRIQPLINGGPSKKAATALNLAFSYLTNEKVFKIDSDMFFISDININELLDKDLVLVPNYKINKLVMWSGVFGINLNNIKLKLDFMPHVAGKGDTFIQSHLLTKDENLTQKLINLISIHYSTDTENTISINNDSVVTFNEAGVTSVQRPEFYGLEIIKESIDKSKNHINMLINNNFPRPLMVDIIDYNGDNFLIHFKSSNHDNMYKNNEYTNNKKVALKNFLKKT